VYYFVTRGPLVHVWDHVIFTLIRSGLLVLFPILLTVALPRAARLVRRRYKSQEAAWARRDGYLDRFKLLDIRYWCMTVIVHAWALFFYLHFRTEAGLSLVMPIILGSVAVVSGAAAVLIAVDLGLKYAFHGRETLEESGLAVGLQWIARVAVISAGLLVLGELWDLRVADLLLDAVRSKLAGRLVATLITAAVAGLLIKCCRWAARSALEGEPELEVSRQKRTLVPILSAAAQLFIAFVALILMLKQIGLDIAPILAGAGIIGVAVGLGAQNLIKDLINGLYILVEDIVSVGDWAVIGEYNGLVESVGLRAVRLRDLANNVHMIPNSSIDIITNMTKNFSSFVFDVRVSFQTDVDRVIQIMESVGRDMEADEKYRLVIIRPLEIFGLDRFEESAAVVRARITTKPMSQWAVGREFNRRLKKALDAAGIEIPVPHRVIHMSGPGTGRPPEAGGG
jgi:small conductance mechanosensitive channel